jgi:hypothetical protein
MIPPRRMVLLACVLAMTAGLADRGDAQITFNSVNPGRVSTYSVDPDALRRDPIETESKASKPYEPAPHFSNRNILADRIEMGTISKADIRADHIRPDQMHWNLITKDDIAPEPLSRKPVLPVMSPGERMTATPTPARPIWSFDQQLRGEPKPDERIGSSIYLGVPNYDLHEASPVPVEHQEETAAFRPAYPTHPMSW